MTSPERFGKALQRARARAGAPSYRHLARGAYAALGEHAPADETIRRYHEGTVSPERADLALVCFLAETYGVAASDLSPVIADRLEYARAVLSRSSCSADLRAAVA